MKKKIFLPVIGLFLMLQCQSQKANGNTTKPMENTDATVINTAGEQQNLIYLNEGETRFFKEYEMNITFSTITEDSRCPEGTNCIWEGVGVAQITLMGTYTRPVTLTLATHNFADKGFSNSGDFNGYTITLKDLSPYPTVDKGLSKLQGSYKIGLEITKTKQPQSSTNR